MDRLLATKSEAVGLVVRAISFQDFQPMWSQSTNVTDRRTDGQTDRRHAIPRPRKCAKVHCAVMITGCDGRQHRSTKFQRPTLTAVVNGRQCRLVCTGLQRWAIRLKSPSTLWKCPFFVRRNICSVVFHDHNSTGCQQLLLSILLVWLLSMLVRYQIYQ